MRYMDNKKKAVDYRFKLLYAIGIITVVSGHCNGGGGLSLWNDWFPYRGMVISLFAFCSGYFYKNQAEQETKKYIQRKIETLIIPLYSYTIFYGILVVILRNMGFMTVKTVFTIMSIWTRAFEDFDWFRYKTDIWYNYVPKGIAHTMIIYVMAGLIIPILMQKTMDILKERKYI